MIYYFTILLSLIILLLYLITGYDFFKVVSYVTLIPAFTSIIYLIMHEIKNRKKEILKHEYIISLFEIAQREDFHISAIKGKSRVQPLVFCRGAFAYVLYDIMIVEKMDGEELQQRLFSLQETANIIGRTNHSTIINYINQIENIQEPQYLYYVNIFKNYLKIKFPNIIFKH